MVKLTLELVMAIVFGIGAAFGGLVTGLIALVSGDSKRQYHQ